MRPATLAGHGGLPDGLAAGAFQRDAMILQHIEHRCVAFGNAVDAMAQQVCAQLVRDGLADQPQGVIGEPAVGGLGLVELQLFLEQVAQAVQQFALQGLFGGAQGFAGVTAEGLGDRRLIGAADQFAKGAGVLVLSRQQIEQ